MDPTREARDREAEGAFGISTYTQQLIEENARDKFGPGSDDPELRKHAGPYVTDDGEITAEGWEVLNDDVMKLERNAMAWLRKKFHGARDDGHAGGDGEELVGSFWFDPENYEHARLVELASESVPYTEGRFSCSFGRCERIDMSDGSYGDLSGSAWDDVSDFGACVLGGAITFSHIPTEVAIRCARTLAQAGKRRAKR